MGCNKIIDITTYYSDVIGVTKTIGQRPQTIVMRIDKANAFYIKTKPLHHSQTILKEDAEGMIFSITVVWNYELEREILGFAEQLQVLAPKRLAGTIQSRLKNTLKKYQDSKEQ